MAWAWQRMNSWALTLIFWSRWWLPREVGRVKGRVLARAQVSQGRGLPTRMGADDEEEDEEAGAVLGLGGGYRPVVKMLTTVDATIGLEVPSVHTKLNSPAR